MKHQNIKKIYNFIFYNNTPIIILGLVLSVGVLAFAAENQVSSSRHQAPNNDQKIEKQFNPMANSGNQGESDEQEDENNEVKNSKLGELKIANKYENSAKIKDKYRLEKTAFILDAVDENAIQTEVGNKNSDEFVPELTLRKWDDEVNFKVKYKHSAKKDIQDVDLEGNKIKWKSDKIEVHYYEMKKGELLHDKVLEHDVFEVEVLLLEKPDTNIVEFDIETKGLKFYYQPSLDEEMNDPTCTPTDCQDSHRPENVVGSYAVYHSTKTNHIIGQKNYMTGKAFHIYRPKIIDSAGKEVWGILNITDNLLTVEIPQEFLDNAVYPVRHAAGLTFGYTTIGTAASPLHYIKGIVKSSGDTGTGNSISIGIYDNWNSGKKIKAALYDSDKNLVTNGTTEERDSGGADGTFHTVNFTNSPSITDQTYYIVGWSDYATVNIGYDSAASGHTRCYYSLAYTDWPSSVAFTTTLNMAYSIYCTYTAGGGETYQPRPGGTGISGGGFMMY